MSGYVYISEVYQGKRKDEHEHEQTNKLDIGLVGGNYIVMMDNCFPLPKLKADGIFACGTIQHNRQGLPILAADKTLKRGDFDYCLSEDELLCYVK